MKEAVLIVAAFVVGCGQNSISNLKTIDDASGLSMAYELTFSIENFESQPLGCATLLAKDDSSFLIAAPVEFLREAGFRVIEWRGEHDGQKFEKIVFDQFAILSLDPRLNLAVLSVAGTTRKQPLQLAKTNGRQYYSKFSAYGARTSRPRPIEVMALKVSGLALARAAEDQPSSYFFQVEGALDFKKVGSPLVTQQGELAAVAIGNFWDSTMYCPADSIRELLLAIRNNVPTSIEIAF